MLEKLLRFALPLTSLAFAGWVLYYPKPYGLCVAIGMMFPVTVFLASRIRPSWFSLIDDKRGQVAHKIGLTAPFVIITAALFLRAFIDFRFPDTAALLMWTGATTLLVGLLLWVTVQGASLSISLLIGVFYSLPAVAFLNAYSQPVQPRSLSAEVVRKHTYTKPRFQTVVVTAEGQSYEILVSKDSFANLESGSKVCLNEHYGLLRLRSVELAHCTR